MTPSSNTTNHQQKRSIALGFALAAMVVFIFVLTLVRLTSNVS